MKLVIVMYLEDDEGCIGGILEDAGATVFSEIEMEGHGPGARGWYGEVAPYRSRMIFTIVDDDVAGAILREVEACEGTRDLRHPAHAVQMGVEDHVVSTEGGNER